MTKQEYRNLREQFDKDLALREYYLRQYYEREYRQFVFMGTHAQRESMLAQWKAANEDRIKLQLEDARRELELQYFGPEGLKEETPAPESVTLAAVPKTPVVEPGLGERLRKAYLTLFW
ncbi:hypothetical protein [Lewinella sp. W8]|uniref:hypothetical protein n=1 Tax=Lewinella sp. W8 TaxID=2528208 RepID=UPI0010674EAC|nr:hypothetical protein [Lewinella sp. W8]MTB50564.1 hypothetical protein [Lewinella sp. W8]